MVADKDTDTQPFFFHDTYNFDNTDVTDRLFLTHLYMYITERFF